MEPTEHFEHDPDDPPPPMNPEAWYWFYANRSAENFLRWLRFMGFIQ